MFLSLWCLYSVYDLKTRKKDVWDHRCSMLTSASAGGSVCQNRKVSNMGLYLVSFYRLVPKSFRKLLHGTPYRNPNWMYDTPSKEMLMDTQGLFNADAQNVTCWSLIKTNRCAGRIFFGSDREPKKSLCLSVDRRLLASRSPPSSCGTKCSAATFLHVDRHLILNFL